MALPLSRLSLLMLPFIGYSIALLGFNLLFGTTGLLSFGHAMFLGIGAYAPRRYREIRCPDLRAVADRGGARSGLISLVGRLLCVRYTRIFFGMLTLAFGMLFHSFLFKFYAVTGGDRACACCARCCSAWNGAAARPRS